jgi:hypothetical protein
MTTFNIWTHPSTGSVRIYISGFGATKVWAEEQAADSFGDTIRLVAVNSNRNRAELENIVNDAERAINQAAGKRINKFSELLVLASK